MPFEELGAILLFLAAVFFLGTLWFHLVETILSWIKKLFAHRRKPPAWHTLPSDEEDRKNI